MKRILASLSALALLAGCDGEGEEARTPDAGGDAAEMAPAPVAAAGAPTDPQIAAIVVAANEVDVQAGELAREKASSAEVRAFGERMIADHTAVNQAASELVARLGVTPEPNPTSEQLRRDGEQARERLRALDGAGFDRAYLDQEIAYHQAVLEAINGTLVPNAQNGELRALLEQTAPAVEAHLRHAEQLRASVGPR